MNTLGWKCKWSVVATTTACLALTLSLSAQVETKTTAAAGNATVVTKVERGEVVTVSGNDLVVKMADGTLRNFENVPASAKVTVDGKQLGVKDLKPGMKLQRTITTTTTPMTITTVETVKGKVWAITPPLSIILTLEDGKNQQFKIPEDQKFEVDGQMVDAFAVRKGMIITATKITEEPAVEVTQSKTVTGQAAPRPRMYRSWSRWGAKRRCRPQRQNQLQHQQQPEAASGLPTWLIWVLLLLVLAAIIWWYMSRKNRSGS